MSRSEATESISFSQMRWENDTLKVFFPRHKDDAVGLTKDEARHVYSNPLAPAVCALRALASYLVIFPKMLIDDNCLFPRTQQKSRFNRLLYEVLMKHEAIFQAHGTDPTEIGSHSIRKGAATYCCAGAIPGPPIVSVCLSVGWTIGKVKERYLKYENSGDQYVRRTLTGISPSSGEFAFSPCYFKPDSNEDFINNLSTFVFPTQDPTLAIFIKHLLASFIYHEEFTTKYTPPESPLMHCSYFSFALTYQDRKEFVEYSLPWEKKEGCPTLTGIPIYCAILNKMYEVHAL